MEDPDKSAPENLYTMTKDPATSPNQPTTLEISFEKGFSSI